VLTRVLRELPAFDDSENALPPENDQHRNWLQAGGEDLVNLECDVYTVILDIHQDIWVVFISLWTRCRNM
jgi:hypothetical protein